MVDDSINAKAAKSLHSSTHPRLQNDITQTKAPIPLHLRLPRATATARAQPSFRYLHAGHSRSHSTITFAEEDQAAHERGKSAEALRIAKGHPGNDAEMALSRQHLNIGDTSNISRPKRRRSREICLHRIRKLIPDLASLTSRTTPPRVAAKISGPRIRRRLPLYALPSAATPSFPPRTAVCLLDDPPTTTPVPAAPKTTAIAADSRMSSTAMCATASTSVDAATVPSPCDRGAPASKSMTLLHERSRLWMSPPV